MDQQTQRSRDFQVLDEERNAAQLNNPLQTPSKKNDEKNALAAKLAGDKDTSVRAEEESIGEGSIKVKQLSWVEAAGLMFTEYIVIAILSFPSSYSVLGLGGGVLATVAVGLVVLYSSHVLWRFCMLHPDSPDIVDLSSRLVPEPWRKTIWVIALIGFLLNNLFIMGLHTLSGAVAFNTLSEHSICTTAFTAIMTVVMLVLSLFRELNQVAILGFIAAGTMFIALLLTLIFLGVQGDPVGYAPGMSFTVRAWAAEGTTFVAGFNAFLNIVYTFVGQILIPSYVADMKRPQDFPKALYLCTFLELILFTIGGAVGYHFIGDEYMVSPAYGALIDPYVKVVAAFTLPTLIVVGVLYSNITSRFIFLCIFESDSIHRLKHTFKGWSVWIAIVVAGYIVSFIIGSGIPFFNELLSLMSSLFDWHFGFVLEGFAFFQIYKGRAWTTPIRKAEGIMNIILIVSGIFILVAGCYSSISAIIADYENGLVAGAFSCENNGF